MKARGFGAVYQRGGMWWVRYHFRGKQYRETSGTSVRSVAVTLLKKRMAEMGQGRLVGPDIEKTAFQDLKKMLLDDYTLNGRKSKPRAELALRRLEEFFGRSRALDITGDRLAAYANARHDERAKPATIRMELAILRRAFRLAHSAGRVSAVPAFPAIHVHNARQGFFEDRESRAVLTQLPEAVQALVEFLSLTGWRKNEALGLEWRHVDLGAGVIRIETTKNDEPRTLPFRALPELAALLKRLRKTTDAVERERGVIVPHVFHREGKRIRSFRGAWDSACKAAGVLGKVPHDFRRTAVRRMERAGVSRSVAMKVTGHKTEAIYKRYAIVSENDIAEGLSKVAKFTTASRRRRA